jgi:cyclic beta-1,2-glucan synthetase
MLVIDPCIPKTWPGFEIVFRHRSSRYDIQIENPNGVSRGVVHAELDDVVLSGDHARIPLANDGAIHRVRVVLG